MGHMIVNRDLREYVSRLPGDNPNVRVEFIRSLIPGTAEFTAWQNYLTIDDRDVAENREKVIELLPNYFQYYLTTVLPQARQRR